MKTVLGTISKRSTVVLYAKKALNIILYISLDMRPCLLRRHITME